jgi:hypothetical protein
MTKVLGVNQVLQKNYRILEEIPQWITDTVGVLPDPFHIQVIGKPKNGKTSFVMQLVKSLASRYDIFYSSLEEGDSKTIQDAFKRVNMTEVAGKVMLGDGFYFNQLMEYLRGPGRRKKIVVIDSLDYMKLTKIQYIKLIETFPRKSFIIICWGGMKAREFVCDDYYGNQIKYMMGAIVGVSSFKTHTVGRYGPCESHTIWAEGAKVQHAKQLQLI